MNRRLLALAALLITLPASAGPASDQEAEGAALLAPFKQNLKAALIKGMESGPVVAISACETEAPLIANGLSKDGVSMGRSSHQLRNPKNAAPAWAVPLLEAYAAGTNMDPVAVALEDGRLGYVEPIKVQPMCLLCHGTALQPDVASRINELYPDDRATGFSDGDFRGIFWVEFPGTPVTGN